jgi:alpha-beta hydrolase superfamily lysophospholipase
MPLSSAPDREAPPSDAVSRTVSSFDGTRIFYDLYDAPSRTTMVVVPGFWRFRRHPSMTQLAAWLQAEGYRTAVIDPRGHGDSEGTYGFNLNEHHDVAAVIEDIQADSIALVGLSYGGAIAITTAARHDIHTAAIALISPVADFSMIVPRINPFTLHRHIAPSQVLHTPRFDWHLKRSPKLSALEDVRDVHAPLCFIHVKNDWLIGHKHSTALFEQANEPKELHIIDIPGNYHADRIFSVAGEQIEPIMRNFLGHFCAK